MTLLWRLRRIKVDDDKTELGTDGTRYAWSRKDLMGAYAVDLIVMIFAFPYTLFPFLAEGRCGLGIALVAVTSSLWIVLSFLAIAGGADMVSGTFRATMWNQTIPDEVRGRTVRVELLSCSMGPLLGQVRSSAVASLTSLRMSLISGGVLCIVGVGVAAFTLLSLWNCDDQTSVDTVREREHRRNRE